MTVKSWHQDGLLTNRSSGIRQYHSIERVDGIKAVWRWAFVVTTSVCPRDRRIYTTNLGS